MKNLENNKMYVGQTIQKVERRINCHYWEAMRNQNDTKLNRAIRKYSPTNFAWKIIKECDNDELDDYEQFYIKIFNTFCNGYNSTTGGQGTQMFRVSDTTKEKIRKFQIDYNKNSEIRKRKQEQMRGCNHHQFNKLGESSKNFGIVRKQTVENIPIIVEIRHLHSKGITFTELANKARKCVKTIKNWCGPDFEKYGGPTTTNRSIKEQSRKRSEKTKENRAVQRLNGSG